MSRSELPPICNVRPRFKGWTKPGPVVELPAGIDLAQDETVDALAGHFRIFQLREGHRFSTDDVLTAWYGTSWAPSVETILDLGSGIGSAAMTAAWRLPRAELTTIEAQSRSVALARKSMAYNGLSERVDVREGDFRQPGILEEDERFDLILGTPPYFPLESGTPSEHPQRMACRFEVRGDIADYCRVACAHLSPGALFACVFPTEQLARVERAALEAELSIVRRRPVELRQGEPPLLTLFAMQRSEDLPPEWRARTWVEPALIVRCTDGSVHPEYAAVKMSFGFPPGG